MKLYGKIALVAAAAGVTMYALKKLEEQETAECEQPIPFNTFYERQEIVDHLTGGNIAGWFRENVPDRKSINLVAYPTKKVQEMLNIADCPDELDEKSNILQMIIVEDAGILNCRMISFGSISDNLVRLFAEKDYFTVEDDEK